MPASLHLVEGVGWAAALVLPPVRNQGNTRPGFVEGIHVKALSPVHGLKHSVNLGCFVFCCKRRNKFTLVIYLVCEAKRSVWQTQKNEPVLYTSILVDCHFNSWIGKIDLNFKSCCAVLWNVRYISLLPRIPMIFLSLIKWAANPSFICPSRRAPAFLTRLLLRGGWPWPSRAACPPASPRPHKATAATLRGCSPQPPTSSAGSGQGGWSWVQCAVSRPTWSEGGSPKDRKGPQPFSFLSYKNRKTAPLVGTPCLPEPSPSTCARSVSKVRAVSRMGSQLVNLRGAETWESRSLLAGGGGSQIVCEAPARRSIRAR